MALTLLEASKHARSPEELAVVRELAEGDLLGSLPFRNISGSGLFWKREESLANVGFRHINQGLAEDYGQTSQQSEALKFFGGDVVVDRAILELEGPEARAYQVQSKIRAMRMAYERVFIKGSETASNGLEFDGLEKRCGEIGGTSQVVDNGGGGLSFAALDEMLDTVDAQGGSKYMIMSKAMRRRLTQAARDGVINGGIQIMQDAMGRKQSYYQDTPIMIVDKDENNNDILGANEAAAGNGLTSSIYCISFGDLLTVGIQNGGLSVRDLGESHSAPQFLTRVEWYCGLATINGRSVARLASIDPAVAAIV
ncbi:hypothetical protein SynSYN20_01676 [Synechococcus sp. SYN20]|uniref:major capsid protein n=1 Tax=Synechococcus sp. SYN20 TaxID=1050714 RepID=UPI001645A124|nr:hypothetical protein [Synechococcus sp. SYN20]QNJ26003.1 hypothetical protein SynSYN20_01676 [Synechococcus sp. SYN20]